MGRTGRWPCRTGQPWWCPWGRATAPTPVDRNAQGAFCRVLFYARVSGLQELTAYSTVAGQEVLKGRRGRMQDKEAEGPGGAAVVVLVAAHYRPSAITREEALLHAVSVCTDCLPPAAFSMTVVRDRDPGS